MTNTEDFSWEGSPVVDTDAAEVGREIEAAFQEPVEDAVVEEVVESTSVPTVSLPEWKRAIKGLAKAGFEVSNKSDYFEVYAALVEFQRDAGIAGMEEGHPTERTLDLLGV